MATTTTTTIATSLFHALYNSRGDDFKHPNGPVGFPPCTTHTHIYRGSAVRPPVGERALRPPVGPVFLQTNEPHAETL